MSYCLYYWPEIPGRGEFVRLAFVAAKQPFREVNNVEKLSELVSPQYAADGRVPHFAVPILEVHPDGGATPFYLSQTPAILQYLAPRLGLDGVQEGAEKTVTQAHVMQLMLTALDWANAAHDVHHPVSTAKYYEDQREEAKLASESFRKERIPKFAKHFEAAIAANLRRSLARRLIGTKTSIADLTLFQVLEGLHFAFPNAMAHLADTTDVTELAAFRHEIRTELQHYLDSPDRRKFGSGVFRHYPELDPL